jgi:hypothetical protein
MLKPCSRAHGKRWYIDDWLSQFADALKPEMLAEYQWLCKDQSIGNPTCMR